MTKDQKIAVVTGAAGFIGFHTSLKLLHNGWKVIGIDCLDDYYDVELKISREKILLEYSNYISLHGNIQSPNFLQSAFDKYRPNYVIHLAAQAGVRYSIDNPRAYLESNVVGSFELLEACRNYCPEHVLMASTSSVYGPSEIMPLNENLKADCQMSFYAATKKATENFAHSYSHLFGIPITMFRFFTVYGPWGRPDMALFKFTEAMMKNENIDVYNFGKMERDFTYIDDLVEGIVRLTDARPDQSRKSSNVDSVSSIAPFRVVNIGNSDAVKLMDFINAIEHELGIKAKINFLPMQPGDVPRTLADTKLLRELVNTKPTTPVQVGIQKFVSWYRTYYKV